MADPESREKRVDVAQDEGLQITRNIRDIAVETHGIARDTAETLMQQGEQLDNVERRMGEMNADLKEADRNLREIEKCCGWCFCFGSRPKDFTESKDYKKVYGKSDSVEEAKKVAISRQPRSSQRAAAKDRQYVAPVLGDGREAEMNENLKITDQALDQLMGMAEDMGDELAAQNEQLDCINAKAEVHDVVLTDFNQRIHIQLK